MTFSLSRHLLPWSLTLGLTFPLANAQEPETAPASAETADTVMSEAATEELKGLPLDDLRKFVEVFDRIKRAYVEEIDDTTLLNNAIRGMLSGLDPHSAYLEPEAFDELQENTSGEFGGLGIEVGMEDGFVKVIAPIDDTPADLAGIEAGDIIVKLDDTSVKGMSLSEAVGAMRGAPGTPIRLTIIRQGEDAPLEFVVKRDIIRVTSVKHRLLGPGLGYVRITQFQAQTGRDFQRAIEKLNKASDGDVKGIVIDLRNNPGGVLQAAVDVSDALLDEGMIVYTEGRIKSSRLRFTATPGDILEGAPVIVLINAGSASASEILAGALQDQGRALIMGEDSFGKGSVQTVLPLDESYGLKLTTARYYTPNGRSIQALGIEPDVLVKRARLTEINGQPAFKEADLSGHLSNGNDENEDGSQGGDSVSDTEALLNTDFQLREAYNLLKGLTVLNARATGD